jgi:hypothetical protein
MVEDIISTLIEQLKQTHIQQQQIIFAIVQAYTRADISIEDTTPVHTAAFPTVIPGFVPIYCRGDLVTIVNRVRRPLNRPIDINDQNAIVLEVVSTSRFNMLTSNGTVTWRDPKNLKHRQDD